MAPLGDIETVKAQPTASCGRGVRLIGKDLTAPKRQRLTAMKELKS